VRSYSLTNHQAERHRYVISVARDAQSRGGSRAVHDALSAGDLLRISAPRNDFPLCEAAPHSVLIAGGIGITPMLAMIKRLHELGAAWQLHYCVPTRAEAAFADELGAFRGVRMHVDAEQQGRFLDLDAVIAGAPPGSHLYCCGPTGMMQAFTASAAGLPPERVHVEHFAPLQAPSVAGGFSVQLARSGVTVAVTPGLTILDALANAGIATTHSCQQGICGTCETRVLAGVPDHRDQVLTQSERDSGETMMICCSGSKSDLLVLDL
jgi:ferredoxin-NADP reductase